MASPADGPKTEHRAASPEASAGAAPVLASGGFANEPPRAPRHPLGGGPMPAPGLNAAIRVTDEQMHRFVILLRARVGHDFSLYQTRPLHRRIQQRVLLCKVPSIEDYLRLLERDAREVDALFLDILIKVTGFFRDAAGFDALGRIAWPALLGGRDPDLPLRLWVPGCSTGQEAYSIAMLVREHLDGRQNPPQLQLFGSDIDPEAVADARAGLYPVGIENELTAARLERWFRKAAGRYRVSPGLRQGCIFAVQDLIQDPPFSRLDLVSCRNLLIYLEPVLQKRILKLFHDALKPDGYLLLGNAETIGTEADLFSLVDKRGKLYRKKAAAIHLAGSGRDRRATRSGFSSMGAASIA